MFYSSTEVFTLRESWRWHAFFLYNESPCYWADNAKTTHFGNLKSLIQQPQHWHVSSQGNAVSINILFRILYFPANYGILITNDLDKHIQAKTNDKRVRRFGDILASLWSRETKLNMRFQYYGILRETSRKWHFPVKTTDDIERKLFEEDDT